MEYTHQDIEKLLGKDYVPGRDYVLETHRGAEAKQAQGWKPMGKMRDGSLNENGTMVVMMGPEPPPPPPPPPKAEPPKEPKRGFMTRTPKPGQGIASPSGVKASGGRIRTTPSKEKSHV